MTFYMQLPTLNRQYINKNAQHHICIFYHSENDWDIFWCDVGWMRENFDHFYLQEHVKLCHFRNHYEVRLLWLYDYSYWYLFALHVISSCKPQTSNYKSYVLDSSRGKIWWWKILRDCASRLKENMEKQQLQSILN